MAAVPTRALRAEGDFGADDAGGEADADGVGPA